MAANTKLLEVKNTRGEVVADVRGLSTYDALYMAGVSAEYLTTDGKTDTKALKTTASVTKVSETR